MKDSLKTLANDALRSARDLSPIILVIGVFQVLVFREPVEHLFSALLGVVLVIAGLSFFLFGLRLALFPIGEGLTLASQRDVILLLVEEHLSRHILEHIGEVGKFDEKPGTGIAVLIDVEDAVGVMHQSAELGGIVEERI